MGVINITPDSFSDGGKFYSSGKPDIAAAVDCAAAMVAEDVDWLDVGGESTRPGAEPVSVEQELERVIPVIETLKSRFDSRISVDTSQPLVIEAAAQAGAQMVNDVRALTREGALSAAAESGMDVCLMHMQGAPDTMQIAPDYQALVEEVCSFLQQRARASQQAGIAREKICIDPGFGFGKSVSHNLQLIDGLPRVGALGYPVLVGFSRKSMIGKITGREAADRVHGTLVLNTLALMHGASIFRVHDAAPARDMIQLVNAYRQANSAAAGERIQTRISF